MSRVETTLETKKANMYFRSQLRMFTLYKIIYLFTFNLYLSGIFIIIKTYLQE